MIKKLIFLFLVSLYMNSQAQTGIGTKTPNEDAALEIGGSTKGLLLPRVALKATNVSDPLGSHVLGMHVYNTATAGTSPNDVRPGEYYNDGSKWIRILSDQDGMDFTGDAWINDPSNTGGGRVKLGTKSNGTARDTNTDVVIKDDGKVGIGTSAPDKALHVNGEILADNTISAPNYTAKVQTISMGTWNMTLGSNAVWTLSDGDNNLTISNIKTGMFGLLRLVNSGSSTITLPTGSKVVNGGGGSVALTKINGAVDILTFYYDGTTYWWTYGNNYN